MLSLFCKPTRMPMIVCRTSWLHCPTKRGSCLWTSWCATPSRRYGRAPCSRYSSTQVNRDMNIPQVSTETVQTLPCCKESQCYHTGRIMHSKRYGSSLLNMIAGTWQEYEQHKALLFDGSIHYNLIRCLLPYKKWHWYLNSSGTKEWFDSELPMWDPNAKSSWNYRTMDSQSIR